MVNTAPLNEASPCVCEVSLSLSSLPTFTPPMMGWLLTVATWALASLPEVTVTCTGVELYTQPLPLRLEGSSRTQ